MENSWFAISQVIGLTIIHSLWQGLLVYAFTRLLFFCFPTAMAKLKYQVATAGLLLTTACFLYTLVDQIKAYDASTHLAFISHAGLPMLFHPHQPVPNQHYQLIDFNIYLPYITFIYIAGFVIHLSKLGYAWFSINRLKRTAFISPLFQLKIDELAQQFDFKFKIRAFISDIVDVPCVVGYIKPVVLLPITLTTGLSAEEAEVILLHELAHINRNDFLWNLLQQLITSLLFFNPFVQLLSRIMDDERENSCDDIVVKLTGQPHVYAKALLKLETHCRPELQLALAATGKKYHLLNRIQRIMKTKKPSGNLRHLLFSLLIIGVSLSSIAWLNPELKNGKLSVKIKKLAIINHLLGDTSSNQALVVQQSKPKKHQNKRTAKKNTDPVLEQLSADMQKHAAKIGKLYSSKEFIKYAEEMGKEGAKMAKVYNTPEMQHLIEQQAKLGAELAAQQPDQATQNRLNSEMETASKEFSKYYDTPEFKRMTAELGRAGAKLATLNANSAAYKKQMAEINRLSQSMTKFNSSPEMKQAQEKLTAAATEIAKQYTNNPEQEKYREQLRRSIDSVTQAYRSQNFETNNARMKELEAKMKAYQQSPQLRKEQEELQKSARKMQEYIKSPAYKKWLKEHPEQRELNEKPERPEQPEQPEQQEKPEQPEKSEPNNS